MKHLKLFEEYSCKYLSDASRIDSVDEVLSAIKNNDYENYIDDPDTDMLLDPHDGYNFQTYIQYDENNNEIVYWEGWSKYCWNSLYNKKEYKGLNKEKAVKKLIDERLKPSLESLGLLFVNYDLIWTESFEDGVDDGYIMKVTFKIL
jgi:hypothetical protein